MKDKYQNGGPEADKLRDELFELVVTRDNTGEAMWLIYTGILLTSIVQLKITSRGCKTDPKTMEANYQKFLEQEKANQTANENASATYTITSG